MPSPQNFILDPFQSQAIQLIEQGHSVLVSAPTGSGKTKIAEAAIAKAMAHRENVIYTAPVKALSNQKFRDFRTVYGKEQVGILTGDVTIQPEAPILIMTTEIYRNSLFDFSERIEKTGCVIFDEIHYLDDPERGTVWEEALLFTPDHIRILALSATIPNVQNLADWITHIHGRPISVIEEKTRPVPLHFLFQCQGYLLKNTQDLRRSGYLNRESWREPYRQRRFSAHLRAKPNRLEPLLLHLEKSDHFPCIYFAFGRKRVEWLAWEAASFRFFADQDNKILLEAYEKLLETYEMQNEKSAQDMKPLIELGIAYHHAGMLPTLKEIIEQLFTSRLLKLIFTTETFALGINMPARSVIFDELEKFYGSGFKYLTTRDFYQMAGRAGRRGMDEEGYVYLRINPHDIPYPEVLRILHSQPEPIRSQLNSSYATLLNLYRDFKENLLDIYPQTFHHFQSHRKKRKEGFELIQRKLSLLKDLKFIAPSGLTSKGEFAASLFGYELLLAEMHSDKVIEDFNERDLNILISGLIYEPRKNEKPPKLSPRQKQLEKMALDYAQLIHRKESNLRIYPYTKPPRFHLASAVEAWTEGREFQELFRFTAADEGELVRHLRMIIQLLREIHFAKGVSDKLKALSGKAKEKINRGVVDAEKQLRH